MEAVNASRAAERARRQKEKEEWDNVVRVFPIDAKKKTEALDMLRAQPLGTTASGFLISSVLIFHLFPLLREVICGLCPGGGEPD